MTPRPRRRAPPPRADTLGIAGMGEPRRALSAQPRPRRCGRVCRGERRISAATDAAKRRQLTVMFCDMVGFTELASRLDPVGLRSVIRGYEDACVACITRYEGYVFQRLGDGIVAFFGYPLAHEGEA